METKDRTQASYNLVDINEQARIAFEKCKETKEQKIERLKKEIKRLKREKKHIIADLEMFDNIINKKEQQLKEIINEK